MKRRVITLIVCGTFLALMMTVCASPSPMTSPQTTMQAGVVAGGGYEPVFQCSAALPAGREIPLGCTVFTVSKGDQVFFGGNDDSINPDSYYWVDPGGTHGYGAIWIGTPDNVQQGVNERGLAYDANGLPRVDVNPHPERQPVSGGYSSYPIRILRECVTVAEVIAWVNTHQWHSYTEPPGANCAVSRQVTETTHLSNLKTPQLADAAGELLSYLEYRAQKGWCALDGEETRWLRELKQAEQW